MKVQEQTRTEGITEDQRQVHTSPWQSDLCTKPKDSWLVPFGLTGMSFHALLDPWERLP